MRRVVLAWLLLVAVLAAACFDERTQFPSGVIFCSNDGRCPTGLACGAANLCWGPGEPRIDAPVAGCLDDELRCFGKEQHRCSGGAFSLVTTCSNACLGGYCVECNPTAKRCNGARPQQCGQTGSWSDLPACPAATPQCEDGECLPPCSPVGSRRCSRDGLGIQECDQAGQFRTISMCPNVCVAGPTPTCGGDCRPGSTQCGADQTAETCDATGEWTTLERCAGVCQNATCSGECHPAATRCNAAGMLETCGADARWGSPTACTFVCNAMTGKCDGVCAPGSRRCNGSKAEVCSPAGAWTLDSECSPMQCTDGRCGPCTDGATQCNAGVPQQCMGGVWKNTQAMACPFVCSPTAGCTGECVPGSTTCDGDMKKTCGQDGRYTSELCGFVCVAGQCTGECKPGTHRCNGETSQTCNSLGAWSSDVTCAFGCDVVSGDCKACVPESMDQTCSNGGCGTRKNNCGQDVECGTCTGPGETCGGGGTAGFCGCTPDSQSVTCGNGTRCLPTVNNCGQIIPCSSMCTAPQTCGGGTTPGSCGCTPTDVSVACANKNCGNVGDACGGQISCWPQGQTQCPGIGQTCGGGGMPNVCGCTPNPQCGTRECGSVSNGCGGTATCGPNNGGCPTGKMCDGTGKCVDNCTPKTTCDSGFECGTQDPGCGAPALNCGTCMPPDVCFPAEHDCRCVPRTTCDSTLACGTESDGCTGTVNCPVDCSVAGKVCNQITNRCRCKTMLEACGSQKCGTAYAGEGCPLQNCGDCPDDRLCNPDSKTCVCRGECGPTCNKCPDPKVCQSSNWTCVCTPNPLACFEIQCGFVDDGCGRQINCADCPNGGQCLNHQCYFSCDANSPTTDPNVPTCSL